MAGKRDQLRVRLIESHTLLQAAHHRGRVIACSKAQVAARLWRIFIIKRCPEFLRLWKLKIWRHDSDDGRGFAVNSDALSHNVWVGAEIASPDFVAEDRDLFCARFVVFGGEIAAQDRRDSDDLEKIFGYVTAGIPLRVVFVSHVDCRTAEVTRHHRK